MAQGPLDVADVDTPGEDGSVLSSTATPLPGGGARNMQLSCHCPITDLRYLALCLLTTSVVGKIAVLAREKGNNFDTH